MGADLLYIALGLVLLFAGGEGLVRGSVAIAERAGLSKMVIGLTIVGFGTSAPELLVSLKAAISGAPEIALGNVIGSNIANILLIIGAGALIMPIAGWERSAVREALVAALVAFVLFGLLKGAFLDRLEGILLLVMLAVYIGATFWLERRNRDSKMFEHETEEFESLGSKQIGWAAIFVIGGIVALVFGANLLVSGAGSIAKAFGVSDAVIGLSLVAVGTSLPELATSISAALKKQSDVVIGNVIGSNIFNVLAILGATAAIIPIEISDRFRGFDMVFMLLLSCALAVVLFATRKIGRSLGLVFICGYGVYLGYLFQSGAIG
ncbi:calcium/sodium antiporter [Pseudosulfitobacter pseudonitzschiae]|uniref:calcium/sodium antiporter n=1 Tax=Pseudosulfitobacter pseudonitzschiae TaxID=1402135 RepID=UPI001AF28706|nr:calcium/sodium antiporter [Pseudosulfitobacter pseudonitzschiae]MBM1818042.1 calcium/sodium antiporter [Pseudosulfitobacter pseudonitzschiae]MBM1835069.1 calcium/sodium antiporter [Pseudosulfitobacter pseudonitzschiae]MBM1839901.1 calcium/sodium antiporter [Pseudosulfitobacter pseudonitzschiae]MBM1844784.1 calcium/sodium antiporter [Pseudosulfitobacter pseudonitzschiae]MBM1849587.1 calcium/sodium antiporter [Pseudosulfitobacter pseudonitzschiae]